MSKFNRHRAGLSMVELMVALTIFAIMVLSVGGVYQKVFRDVSNARLSTKAREYADAEVARLQMLARIPRRYTTADAPNQASVGQLVYQNGELIPYGYSVAISTPQIGPSGGELVKYPDAVGNYNTSGTEEQIYMRRTRTVQVFNVGADDEYKRVTVTLSDPQHRIEDIVVTTDLKKPHSRALDTRVATGDADFTGRVEDRDTQAPIVASTNAYVRLIPSDGSTTRYSSVDSSGRFYFAPPLNTNVSYTVSMEYPDAYWTRAFARTMQPGNNINVGDNGDITYLSPRRWANVRVRLTDIETGVPLVGASAIISHNGVVPNSKPPSYYDQKTDANGYLQYRIEIPQPDLYTYNQYYVSQVSSTNYITRGFSYSSNSAVLLDTSHTVDMAFGLYSVKTGNLQITVLKSDGTIQPKAQVIIYFAGNQTQPVPNGTGYTDSNGQVLFRNIAVNDQNNPTQTSKRVYVYVKAALHKTPAVSSTYVDVAANGTTPMTIQMPGDALYWASAQGKMIVTKGYTTTVNAKAYYYGHDGPGVVDVLRGPNLSSFLSESPGTFTAATYNWQVDDPSKIQLIDGASPDQKTILGLDDGDAAVTLTVTFNYTWAGVPHTLTLTQTWTVSCQDGIADWAPAISPVTPRQAPGTTRRYQVTAAVYPYDATYTWTITGNGVASWTPVGCDGSAASNGTNASRCVDVTAVNTPLGSTINLSAVMASVSINRSQSAAESVEVNLDPLAVSLTPAGPITMQPGAVQAFHANTSGGSGTYTFQWWMLDAATGVENDSIGTLSSNNTQDTVFTGLQIGNINVKVRMTDTVTGLYVEAFALVQVQPSGGLTQ